MLRFIAYGVLLFATLVASISPISIKGSKLYDQDGKQFFVKGILLPKLRFTFVRNTNLDSLLQVSFTREWERLTYCVTENNASSMLD
jgi:hypothetical protein